MKTVDELLNDLAEELNEVRERIFEQGIYKNDFNKAQQLVAQIRYLCHYHK